MRYLFAILIAVTLCAVPISAGAVTASITLDVHQDIDVPRDKLPNDFHVVGQIKSYISAPVLVWHTDGPFTIFGSTITKVDPLNPADPWYNFTADWSLPVGSPGIPYCTVIHLGLFFDVEGANTVINLKGWWTLDGVPMGEVIIGQHNNGFVPVGGFDVIENPGTEGDKIRITNGKQPDTPLPPPPGPTPPPFETEIVQMDVIGFLPGQAPSPTALTETGAQSQWSWVHVNNANGLPISTENPIYVMPDSFFDVFLEVTMPGHPGLPAGQQIHLQPGGSLVARTLTRFTNNAGVPEARWQWDVHQAPNTVDWRPGNEYKWLQMPDISNTGIDIRCDVNDGKPRILADDFKCIETGPITDVHFWGSWLNDNKGQIQKIHLSIHKDVPAGPTGTFSHPDDPAVWEADFFPGQFSEKLYKELPTTQGEWWWDPYTNTLQPNGDRQVWQYDIPITGTQAPFFQTGTPQQPMIYWLDVSVTLNSVLPPAIQPQFGWKTRDWRIENFGGGHFMDDAVWTWIPMGMGWMELRYPSSHPQAPNSLDMSFVITGLTRQRDWGDAPDDLQLPRYPTLSIHNGANHGIIPGFCLGATVDAEADGQPNATATGDDINPPAGPNDEDGVTWAGPLTAGQPYNVTVTVSAPGFLDMWIDYNANKSWSDAGEQIYASAWLPVAGAYNVNFTVPAGAAIGQTFARFRFSSTGGLQPTGWANDGEVEDYTVDIQQPPRELDWGDAPDTKDVPRYPTLAIHNGARHGIIPGFCLGNLIDAEGDGQPNANATGDDINPPLGLDDEDGVTFAGPLIAGQNYTITVVASAPGLLDVWVDFGANGSWDPGEQIFGSQWLVPGPNVLTFFVPAGSTVGQTFARFRFSSTGGLTPVGWANDGEVEDYMVDIQQQTTQPMDWGDAPDATGAIGYPTLAINNGARHKIVSGFCLGATIDAEVDGQPNATATGDDINPPAGPNDEDGVTFVGPLTVGQNYTVTVVASAAGKLDAWVDFNANKTWTDAGEQIFTSVPLVAGANALTFFVPVGSNIGQTFARFRLSSAGGLTTVGLANDGEVEDYMVTIQQPPQELDWGDAPDTKEVPRYPTLAIHNGARHIINPLMHLGKFIDAEPDGQPNLNATGDDINPPLWPNDEDGVVFKPIYAGCWAKVRVEASLPGILNAWMDFNGDGDWADPGEQIFTNKLVVAGYNYLTYQVPANAVVTQPTFARFRYSSAIGLSYTGLAQDGEVEDYMVGIRPMPIIVNKAEAKKKLLNTEVVIMRDVVTANFGINGWYFEEPDRWILNTLRPGRWAGIGVLVDQGDPTNGIPPDTAPWVPGDIVSCMGVTTLTPNGELMIQEVASWWEGHTEPLKPLGQNNRNSGGGRFGLQPGLIDNIGGNPPGAAPKFSANLNTVGLLVRLWGNCTRVERDMLGNPVDAWLEDGSYLWDGKWYTAAKPCMGVKVHFPTPPGIPIDEGKYYAATGIMRTSLPTLAGAYARWLWVVDINAGP